MDTHGHDCKVLFVVYTLACVLLRFITLHFVNFVHYIWIFVYYHYYHYCVVASS